MSKCLLNEKLQIWNFVVDFTNKSKFCATFLASKKSNQYFSTKKLLIRVSYEKTAQKNVGEIDTLSKNPNFLRLCWISIYFDTQLFKRSAPLVSLKARTKNTFWKPFLLLRLFFFFFYCVCKRSWPLRSKKPVPTKWKMHTRKHKRMPAKWKKRARKHVCMPVNGPKP